MSVITDNEAGIREHIGSFDGSLPDPKELFSTAVIVSPPWPRSGAAWIIKNQIDFYAARGLHTALVVVPIHSWLIRDHPAWEKIESDFRELGAGQIFRAPIEPGRYRVAKYAATILYAGRGSVIDWQFAVAKAANVSDPLRTFLRSLSAPLLHVNHVQTLGFARRLRGIMRARNKAIPIVLETHDVQSQLMLEVRELNPWTRQQDSYQRMMRSEKVHLKKASVLVHLSMDDFSLFSRELPGLHHFLVLPTISKEFVANVKSATPLERQIDLLFVGQKHGPNVAGLKWFLEQVWPLLAAKEYKFSIVGPVADLFREQHPKLFESFQSQFVGEVANLASYYRSARCVIAPMVSGSGTSIKTIEALALGMPFVGTALAFRGMPKERIRAAGLESHDTPPGFATAIVDALSGAQAYGERNRTIYHELFSIQANWASRDNVAAAAASQRK